MREEHHVLQEKKKSYNTVQFNLPHSLSHQAGRQALQRGGVRCQARVFFQGWAMCLNKAEHEKQVETTTYRKVVTALLVKLLHGASVQMSTTTCT